jgi:hypothetical protein
LVPDQKPPANFAGGFFIGKTGRGESLSMGQAAEQSQLARQDDGQQQPDQPFPEPQAALGGGGQPELEFHRPQRDHIAIAETLTGFNWLEIHQQSGSRLQPDLNAGTLA